MLVFFTTLVYMAIVGQPVSAFLQYLPQSVLSLATECAVEQSEILQCAESDWTPDSITCDQLQSFADCNVVGLRKCYARNPELGKNAEVIKFFGELTVMREEIVAKKSCTDVDFSALDAFVLEIQGLTPKPASPPVQPPPAPPTGERDPDYAVGTFLKWIPRSIDPLLDGPCNSERASFIACGPGDVSLASVTCPMMKDANDCYGGALDTCHQREGANLQNHPSTLKFLDEFAVRRLAITNYGCLGSEPDFSAFDSVAAEIRAAAAPVSATPNPSTPRPSTPRPSTPRPSIPPASSAVPQSPPKSTQQPATPGSPGVGGPCGAYKTYPPAPTLNPELMTQGFLQYMPRSSLDFSLACAYEQRDLLACGDDSWTPLTITCDELQSYIDCSADVMHACHYRVHNLRDEPNVRKFLKESGDLRDTLANLKGCALNTEKHDGAVSAILAGPPPPLPPCPQGVTASPAADPTVPQSSSGDESPPAGAGGQRGIDSLLREDRSNGSDRRGLILGLFMGGLTLVGSTLFTAWAGDWQLICAK